jgi:putative ABC transport system permease protein
MIALRNIFRRKLRNFLIFLGISIAISIFISLSSISTGMKTQIQDIVTRYSVDIVVQPKGADSLIMSRIAVADFEQLRRLKGVRDAFPMIMGAIKTPWNTYFPVIGVSSIKTFSNKFSLSGGRLFTPDKRELLLGIAAAEKLGYQLQNKILLAHNEMFTISGIYYFGSSMVDNGAILDIKDAQRLLKREDYINMAFIQTAKNARPEDTIAVINTAFPHLSAIRSSDYTGQVELFKALDAFVWLISAISIFSCGILIMNTMLMAVSERTKEIGILLAVGWSRFMIFRTIVTEAMLICVAGGIFGSVISLITLNVLADYTTTGLGWIPTTISLKTAYAGVGLSVLCGLISSLSPAAFASKMSPAEALRHE